MPNINITTTHTITCENAPVEDVYRELDEKFPRLNPLDEAYKYAVDAKDDIVRQLTQERADHEGDRGEMQAMVAELTRERDEVQKRLEESLAVKETLIAENTNLEAANEVILSGGSRPALPKGMRIAEHPKYGKGIATVRGWAATLFTHEDIDRSDRDKLRNVSTALLTFLDSEPEPEPAPLPKPEDCKEGDLYRAKMDYDGRRGVGVAVRCDPDDPTAPWFVILDDGDRWWNPDSAVTLLARLLPDREVQA